MKVKEYIQILNSGSVEEKIQAGIMDLDTLFPNGAGKDEFIKLSVTHGLSEYFIEKYKDKLDWTLISFYQKLSEEFIEKYIDKLDLELIQGNRKIKLSDDFKKKHDLLS